MTGGRDLSALRRPLSRREALALTRDLPTGHPKRDTRPRSIAGRIALAVLQTVGFAIVAITIVATGYGMWMSLRTSPWSVLAWLIPAGAIAVALITFLATQWWTAPVRRARLVLLARENGWDHESVAHPPRGALFAFGAERTVHDRMRLRRAPRVEIADYSVRVDNGKSSTTVRYAYLAIALPQALPHIVLDAVATSRGRRSPLVLSDGFAPDQRLSLEGDFDEHFRLFAPKGYEQDALYLFTPDIMALFIDLAGAYDVEIIDGWLHLYGLPATLTEPTPQRWEATFALIDALDAKLEQWERWRDGSKKSHAPKGAPRALARPKPGVAAAGARLRPVRTRDRLRRMSVLVGAVILIFGIAAAFILPMLGY